MTLSVLNSVGCNDKLVPCHRLPFIYIRLYHQHLVEPSGHARRSRPSSVARHPSPVARRPSPVARRRSSVEGRGLLFRKSSYVSPLHFIVLKVKLVSNSFTRGLSHVEWYMDRRGTLHFIKSAALSCGVPRSRQPYLLSGLWT